MEAVSFHSTDRALLFLRPLRFFPIKPKESVVFRGKKDYAVFLISEQTFHLLQLNSTSFFVMVDRPSGGSRAHLKLSKQVNQWPSETYTFAACLITSAVIPISQSSAGTCDPP